MDNLNMFPFLYESNIIDSNLNIIEDEEENDKEIEEEEPEEEISIYKLLKLNKK